MKKIFLFVFFSVIIAEITNAQNTDKILGFGVMGGLNEYNGDWGNGLYNPPAYGFGSLSLHFFLNPIFDLGVQSSYGAYGFSKNFKENFLGEKLDVELLGRFKFYNGKILSENAKLAPFITAGIGFASYSGDRIYDEGVDFIVPVGAGIKYNITSCIAFQYQFLYTYTNNDSREYATAVDRDNYTQQSLGLVFSFGGIKDTDGDGVSDELDKCLGTPAGITVDINGCPVDVDKDGIADYLDKCPDVKGLASFSGCPDTDGDGIQDSEDKCANTPKGVTIDKFGCPVDIDGDGVADYLDKCPNVKGISAFNGCPDTDGDGIQDSEDRCPNEKGVFSLKGCPDRDNDGVADIDDKCPDVFGIALNKGCPEVKEETKKIFEQALTGIQFEVGSYKIKNTSNVILDQVVKVMVDNPSYNLEINGHTDNQGDVQKNLELSQNRADAVKKYITDKGIAANRMTAKGFGVTVPIADNKTAEGRSKNRRVEFKVNF